MIKPFKIDQNEPAFPDPSHANPQYVTEGRAGMTIRTWLAGQALQGILANCDIDATSNEESHARYCVNHADALIAELNKTN
jgi:hypothetical protein